MVGCQRSGTDMVMDVFERSRFARAYNEDVYSAAFLDYRLRPREVIDALVRRSTAPTVAFKPVCDSHRTDEILDAHAGAKAVWMLRRHGDVANSAVRNFGDHQRDIQRRIAAGETDALGWRAERLPADVRETIRSLYSDRMTPEEGAALFWWTRNRFLFDLGLDRDPRVLLVRYEDLVRAPAAGFGRLFAFAGCPLEPDVTRGVFDTSVGKRPEPALDARIRGLCLEMEERLEAAHAAGLAREAGRSV